MEWIHITDRQPLHEQEIVQIDPPYEGHYTMGMRKYYQSCSWDELLGYCSAYSWMVPDFWWIAAENFPFPDRVSS